MSELSQVERVHPLAVAASRRAGVGDNEPVTSLKQNLQSDLTAAIRKRDEVGVATLRMALAAVTTEEVAGKTSRTLSDAEVVAVLTREAKKRREAAAAYTDAHRPELADRELLELDFLVQYLPEPLTAEQVRTIVAEAVASAARDGMTGMRAMGPVMKQVTPQTTGRFDGAEVAKLVRGALS